MKQEQKVDANSCCMNCGMNSCCHQEWHGGRYVLLRWALGLLILVSTFALGYKIGEFKSEFWNRAYMGHDVMYMRGGPMMMTAPVMGGQAGTIRFSTPDGTWSAPVPTPTPTPTKVK